MICFVNASAPSFTYHDVVWSSSDAWTTSKSPSSSTSRGCPTPTRRLREAADARDAQPSTMADIYYVGIGSMMNPDAIRKRGIKPLESCPCKCVDFERRFWGAYGMAEVHEKPGAEFHAVPPLLDQSRLKSMQRVERVFYVAPLDLVLLCEAPQSVVSVYSPRQAACLRELTSSATATQWPEATA